MGQPSTLPTSRRIARRQALKKEGYDANRLRRLLAEHGTKAVIPSVVSRRNPILTMGESTKAATASNA
jgi:hypothetical protein